MNLKNQLSPKGTVFSEKIERIGKRILLGFTAFIIFLFIITSFMDDPDPSSYAVKKTPASAVKVEKEEKDLSIRAFVLSKHFVESFLKSPSTADFPFLDYSVLELGDDRYSIQSYVDSQNSFGATMRTRWKAVLRYNGGSESDINNWTLRRLEFDGEEMYQAPLEQ